jgi:hypothetical protein
MTDAQGSSLSMEFVNQRRKELESYVRALLADSALFQSQVLCAFLQACVSFLFLLARQLLSSLFLSHLMVAQGSKSESVSALSRQCSELEQRFTGLSAAVKRLEAQMKRLETLNPALALSPTTKGLDGSGSVGGLGSGSGPGSGSSSASSTVTAATAPPASLEASSALPQSAVEELLQEVKSLKRRLALVELKAATSPSSFASSSSSSASSARHNTRQKHSVSVVSGDGLDGLELGGGEAARFNGGVGGELIFKQTELFGGGGGGAALPQRTMSHVELKPRAAHSRSSAAASGSGHSKKMRPKRSLSDKSAAAAAAANAALANPYASGLSLALAASERWAAEDGSGSGFGAGAGGSKLDRANLSAVLTVQLCTPSVLFWLCSALRQMCLICVIAIAFGRLQHYIQRSRDQWSPKQANGTGAGAGAGGGSGSGGSGSGGGQNSYRNRSLSESHVSDRLVCATALCAVLLPAPCSALRLPLVLPPPLPVAEPLRSLYVVYRRSSIIRIARSAITSSMPQSSVCRRASPPPLPLPLPLLLRLPPLPVATAAPLKAQRPV